MQNAKEFVIYLQTGNNNSRPNKSSWNTLSAIDDNTLPSPNKHPFKTTPYKLNGKWPKLYRYVVDSEVKANIYMPFKGQKYLSLSHRMFRNECGLFSFGRHYISILIVIQQTNGFDGYKSQRC